MANKVSYSIKCNLKIKHYNSFTDSTNVSDLVIVSGNTTTKKPDTQITNEEEKEGLDREMNFTIGDVIFNRKIFQPNEIKATVKIQPYIDKDSSKNGKLPDLSTIRKMFLNKPVELEIGVYENDSSTPSEKINAQNYYIYTLQPRYKNNSSSTEVEVSLIIKSLDHLMTLNKYSQAYLARKFKGEILASVNRFKLTYPSLQSLTEEEENALTLQLNDSLQLQNLFYGKATTQKEFIQPYLVQYNESFYDFIVRIANRCGEFLYFEDGKIGLGLNLNVDPTKKTIDNLTDKDYISLATEDYSEVILDSISDLEPLNVTDYSRDSLKDKFEGFKENGSDSKNSNFKQIEASENGGEIIYKSTGTTENLMFPSDTELGKTPLKDGSEKYEDYYYNSEISNDEFYMPLYKEGFGSTAFADKMSEISRGSAEKHKAHVVATVLAATNLMDLVLDLAEEYIELALITEKYKNTKNERGQERFIKPYSPTVDTNENSQDYKSLPPHVVPFSEDVPARWTTLEYYSDIRKKQEALQRQMVEIIFDTKFKNIKLGDILLLKDVSEKIFYVVTEVNISQKNDEKSNVSYGSMIVKAIPMLSVATNSYRAFPPVVEGDVFRYSGPQTAFVVDAADPKHQGRVRIRYPWQTNAEVIPFEEFETTNQEAKDIIKKYKEEKTKAASPWIRMAVPSSSKSGGIYFEAEPGDEVLVNFDNGNVERPYVVGSLYSKNNIAPVIKGRRVLKSKFGHTLRFKDPSDGVSEVTDSLGVQRVLGQLFPITDMISLWSGKDFIEGDSSGWDLLTGGIDLSDSFGLYSISMSSDERSIKISSPFGDVGINAFTGITISAPNGNIKIVGKNVDISASNKVNITSGSNLSQDAYWKSTILGDFTSVKNASANIMGRISEKYSPINLGLIRNVLEIVLRPIDGTLSLHSDSFVKIEAGEGKAEIPKDNYSPFYKNNLKKVDYEKEEKKLQDAFADINDYLNLSVLAVNGMYEAFLKTTVKYRSALREIYQLYEMIDEDANPIKYEDLIKKLYASKFEPFKLKDISNRHVRFRIATIRDLDSRNGEIKRINQSIENLNLQFETLWKKFNKPAHGYKYSMSSDKMASFSNKKYTKNDELHQELRSNIISLYKGKKGLFQNISKTQDVNSAITLLNPQLPFRITRYKNKLIQDTIKELAKMMLSKFNQFFPDYILTFNPPANVSNGWDESVKNLKISIKPPAEPSFLSKVGEGIAEDILKDISGFFKDFTVWKDGQGVKGKILMSDRENKTIRTDDQGGFEVVDNEAITLNSALSGKVIELREKLLFK